MVAIIYALLFWSGQPATPKVYTWGFRTPAECRERAEQQQYRRYRCVPVFHGRDEQIVR